MALLRSDDLACRPRGGRLGRRPTAEESRETPVRGSTARTGDRSGAGRPAVGSSPPSSSRSEVVMGAHRTTQAPPPAAARRRRPTGRRVAATVALAGGLLLVTSALSVAVDDFPRGLVVLACGVVVAAGTWEGVLRRGWARVGALAVATAALAGAALLLVDEGFLRDLGLLAAGALIWNVGARLAFRPGVDQVPADRPRRPVLFINPRSGDGKAERYRLASEARARGIGTVRLQPGDDLAELVRRAVDDGADALAMAGGDSSQAVVAAAAADAGLPYACIPSGTRNHFALDLGVDRDDVVGALDALVNGGEHRVDLAEVNGRVFVNNVSLGVYAEAVQRAGYRDAKLRTLLDTVPDAVGPDGEKFELRWRGPGGHDRRQRRPRVRSGRHALHRARPRRGATQG